MHEPERVYVFIDGSNFYHLCKENLGRVDVDLGAFAAWLVGAERKLVRAYYYNCPLPPDSGADAVRKQQKFFGVLSRTPYLEVRLGKLVRRRTTCRSCGAVEDRWTEKGVDMRIGIDMLSAASKGHYGTAILVSGDGDFAEAVQAVKDLGKHVEVASFPRGRADALVQAADMYRNLTPEDMARFFVNA